ncbi:MAG TPA: hypothetical protein VLF63_01935 [Patescibacteria group bacterium]|nr:hypothetical protein [Patescibacteria group bacterium]
MLHPIQWCAGFIISFVALVFLLPIHQQAVFTYHLSHFQYKLTLLLIAAPSLIVWFVAFWSYSQLLKYAKSLGHNHEGESFHQIAIGLAWLAWSLPIGAILSRLLALGDGSSSFMHVSLIIISNYIDLILPLVAFINISIGVKILFNSSKFEINNTITDLINYILLFIGLVYCLVILKTFNLNSLSSSHNPYHLAGWLLIISLLIPYIYGWSLGVKSAYWLNSYSNHISGAIYKRALKIFSLGLTTIIIGFVIIQYISSTYPTYGRLIFNIHLVINVFVRIIVGIGFVAIAYGASKLKKIEEV